MADTLLRPAAVDDDAPPPVRHDVRRLDRLWGDMVRYSCLDFD